MKAIFFLAVFFINSYVGIGIAIHDNEDFDKYIVAGQGENLGIIMRN